ncbi:MAG: uncharacterized protein QOJ51_5514 [Acidobacteriaceae bacterium]|nr:uncharacterized protein [Acidobacteriaceae bacterium]
MGTTEEGRFDTTEASPWMRPFVPPRFLRNAHLQTIVGNLMPRTYSLPEPESQLIEVESATSHGASFVLCQCHWQPAEVRSQRLTMIIVHGLEGFLFFGLRFGDLGARLGSRVQRRPHEYA